MPAANITHCTLFIPHLIPPLAVGEALWRATAAPQIKALLARAQYQRFDETDSAAGLCDCFGIARQYDRPLAPLLAAHAGLPADRGYWLCATPVHLETRRNALVLADPGALAITAAESALLVTTLARHLRGEKIELHAPQPGQWFLQCEAPPALTTAALDSAIGHDVRPALPQGPDHARWHRILTEIQMLLHSHPVNEARDVCARLPVNSVWLWGGGTLPPRQPASFNHVWSNDDTVLALARHAQCASAAAPARITPDTLEQGSHFFSTELLARPLRQDGQGDLQAWSAAVTALDIDWFQPLLEALRARRVNSLTLVTSGPTGIQWFRLSAWDLYKFWRKNKYL